MCLKAFHRITEGVSFEDASLLQGGLQGNIGTDFFTQPAVTGQRVRVGHKKKVDAKKKRNKEKIV